MTDQLTDAEAAWLRIARLHPALYRQAGMRIVLKGWDDEHAAEGDELLAAYDAQKRREIQSALIESIRGQVESLIGRGASDYRWSSFDNMTDHNYYCSVEMKGVDWKLAGLCVNAIRDLRAKEDEQP